MTTLIERLDYEDGSWTGQWRNGSHAHWGGHWLRQHGLDSWNLPAPVVAGIRNGLRADDPKAKELPDEQGGSVALGDEHEQPSPACMLPAISTASSNKQRCQIIC
jgi:hypothetical protein